MGREKSDGRVVPQGRRKAVATGSESMANLDGHEAGNGGHSQGKPKVCARGGKATTFSQQAEQLGLFFEPADSPQGDVAGADVGQPTPATRAVPMSKDTKGESLPAMTMEDVADRWNLERAFRRVKSNKGAPGPDRQSVAIVEAHLEEILPELSRTLLDETYRPGMIRRVWIPKPGGGQRGLGIPNVIDRIVQQAVHQVMAPHYDPTFHPSSHGFRPERSCHTAIAEAKGYLEDGAEWVVDLDLEKFFDRVNHDRLLSRLETRVYDRRLIELIRKMLKAKVVMPDGVVVSSEEGTPQGGPLSPLLSNIVLDELDCEMARRGYHFVRYADDANIYVRSERAGKRVMASITRFIERRLRLKVNLAKSAVARPGGRHFLGFRLTRRMRGGDADVMLSMRSLHRIYETIRSKTPRTWGNTIEACIRINNQYLLGWIGFFRILSAAERRALGYMDAHIRRRLRAIVLRHWKRRRTMVRRLIKHGVPARTAWRSVYGRRKSWWALSHTAAVDRALNAWLFRRTGLVSLQERWDHFNPRPVIAPTQLSLRLG
jgi:RNA-directed DNA polymerase